MSENIFLLGGKALYLQRTNGQEDETQSRRPNY